MLTFAIAHLHTQTMAKLALTLTLFICLLAAFSHAQSPSTGSDPESSVIQLPSEKPVSDHETTAFLVKFEASDDHQPLPLTLIRFRPVDRRFHRGPLPLAFRRGRQWAHHTIPYGNDMILSSDRTDRMPFGAGARWAEFRREDRPMNPFDHRADIEWPPRHHHRPHHHHDHHDRHDEYHHDHDHDLHEHGNGFLKSFRKFLGHF